MRSIQIALTAVLAAIMFTITTFISGILSYPLLPYLKFDPAEIIVVLALFLFGPAVAFPLAALHFILLHFPSTQFPIIGPGMKFLAVITTLVGSYLAFKLSKSNSLKIRLVYAIGASLILRTVVMTLANYAVLTTIFAPFLDGLFKTIPQITGLTASDFTGKLTLILILTAFYNVVHVFITILPAFWVAMLPTLPKLISPISNHWLISLLRSGEKRIR